MLNAHRHDKLIEAMKKMLSHSFVLDLMETTAADTFLHFENLVDEHRGALAKVARGDEPRGDDDTSLPVQTALRQLVPSIGHFFTRLPLRDAFLRYDARYSLSRRKFVSPTFNELRHIMNLAQIMALAPSLGLVTFDGDQTLYADGGNFDNEEIRNFIIALLENGVYVAVVTAASYGEDGSGYERRLEGLMTGLRDQASPAARQRFLVCGGECNYLFRCSEEGRLAFVPLETWCAEVQVRERESTESIITVQCSGSSVATHMCNHWKTDHGCRLR